jgi:hypothetical protein
MASVEQQEVIEQFDWERIGRELARPFDPEIVLWRPQGRPEAHKRVLIVPYVDARDVMDRLDSTVGLGGWSFELTPVVTEGGELRVARGRLSIHGVRREDVGGSSTFETSKGCAGDTLKRCAVGFGIARYLYHLPPVHAVLDGAGQIPEPVLAKLRAALARQASDTARDAAHDAIMAAATTNGTNGAHPS